MVKMTFCVVSILVVLLVASASAAINCAEKENHTMCTTSATALGADCGSEGVSNVPTTAEQTTLLNYHNDIRRKAAKGNENAVKDGPLPAAANMMKMMWDSEIATYAQRLADQCVFRHDCYACREVENGRFQVGQNVAMRWGQTTDTNFPARVDWVETINGWYDGEVGNFSTAYVDRYTFDHTYGHYSQLIWAKSRSLGCGGSMWVDGALRYYLVVCNYGAAANFANATTYVAGTLCSACPSGYKTCDDGLCAPSTL